MNVTASTLDKICTKFPVKSLDQKAVDERWRGFSSHKFVKMAKI